MSVRATWKAADVSRLYKAAKAAGVDPDQVEIEVKPDGAMVLRTAAKGRDGKAGDNPWDEVLQQ